MLENIIEHTTKNDITSLVIYWICCGCFIDFRQHLCTFEINYIDDKVHYMIKTKTTLTKSTIYVLELEIIDIEREGENYFIIHCIHHIHISSEEVDGLYNN